VAAFAVDAFVAVYARTRFTAEATFSAEFFGTNVTIFEIYFIVYFFASFAPDQFEFFFNL
jgi:hypothetical protein